MGFSGFPGRNRCLESLARTMHADLQLSGTGSDPAELSAFQISSGYFRVLGVPPARGREFDFSEERPGTQRVS